ncbi:DinB family protein [Algoriphagus namhaensis]|uniref:DinB family protein n=1 Tax=Algoriphagus namhaensis TaxID=915353 RepID=A0ABV8ALP4_9BACT
MKTPVLFSLIFLFSLSALQAQSQNEFFEKQLKYSHDTENWYPSLSVAVDGLTAEQANWKDDSENHSIGQLLSHLTFWNGRLLESMQGGTPPNFNGNNDETFDAFDEVGLELQIQDLDSIMTAMEKKTAEMTPKEIEGWGETLANIASHNAYHIGQIVFIRKQNGWWR